MKIVQLVSHEGYLHALADDGSIYYLASDPDTGEDWWYQLDGPMHGNVVVSIHDVSELATTTLTLQGPSG